MSGLIDHPSKQYQDTKSVSEEIMSLFSKIGARFEAEDDDEKQWMIDHSSNPRIAEVLEDFTVMMLHVLDAIGQLEPVNGITISKHFDMQKGTISKSTRRLLAKKLIEKESLPNNKKEVLFRLTPLGRELFEVHRALHQQMGKGIIQFLQRYEPDKLEFLVGMLQDFLKTPRIDLEFRPDLLDESPDRK